MRESTKTRKWLPFVEDIRNSLRENAKEISLRLASYRLLMDEAARDAIDRRQRDTSRKWSESD